MENFFYSLMQNLGVLSADYGPYSAMVDFGVMSILLVFAQILRSKIKLLQNLYLPASLIAGGFGIFLGKDFLNILPFSANIGSYSYLLSCVLVAGLFLGYNEKTNPKKVWDEAGDSLALNLGMEVGQYGFSIVIGTVLMMLIFPEVPATFAALMPSGFSGGFAYAASIGGTITEMTGWQDAAAIAQTFSTIGLLLGVFGGILLINIYCRRGATRFVSDVKDIPQELKTGFLEEDSREVIGEQTTSAMAIDSITWHLGLIGIGTVLGYVMYQAIRPIVEISFFSTALICGVLVNIFLKRIGCQKYVDKRVVTRITSSVADYLVGFGIASISVNIVVSYMGPLLMFVALGIILCVANFFICKALFHNFWFERTIFCFGWSLGLISLGITLLRIIDPEFRSRTLEDYGISQVVISPAEIAIVAFTPIFVSNGQPFVIGGIYIAIWAFLTFICWKKYGITKYKINEVRPSEQVILDQMAAQKAAK